MVINKICEYCKTEFIAKRISTRYCSPDCNKKHYKELSRIRVIERTKNKQNKKSNFNIKINEIEQKPFLSISETCVLLGISRSSLNRYIKSGKLEVVKLDKKVIIKRKNVNDFLKAYKAVKIPDDVRKIKSYFNPKDFYFFGEVQNLYKINEKTLNINLKNNNVEKIKIGKYNYVRKSEILKIFGKPVKNPNK